MVVHKMNGKEEKKLGGFCNNSREWYIEGPKSVWWEEEQKEADARKSAEAVAKDSASQLVWLNG